MMREIMKLIVPLIAYIFFTFGLSAEGDADLPISIECRNEQDKITLSVKTNLLSGTTLLSYKDESSAEPTLDVTDLYFEELIVSNRMIFKIEGVWNAKTKAIKNRYFNLGFSGSSESLKPYSFTYSEFDQAKAPNETISYSFSFDKKEKDFTCISRGL